MTGRPALSNTQIACARLTERHFYRLGYSVAACARKSGRPIKTVTNDLRAVGIKIRGNVGLYRQTRPGRRLRDIRASVFTILRKPRPNQADGSLCSVPATSAPDGG